MPRQSITATIVFLTTALATGANAEPYELRAVYQFDGNSKPDDVLLEDYDIIPRDAINANFLKLIVRLKVDDTSKAALGNLKRLSFSPSCMSSACSNVMKRRSAADFQLPQASAQDQDVFLAVDVAGDSEPERIDIQVRSTFGDSFLCAKELEYRLKKGKAVDAWPALAPLLSTGNGTSVMTLKADDLHALAVLARTGLQTGAVPLVASYCSVVNDHINWAAVAAQAKKNAAGTPDPKASPITATVAEGDAIRVLQEKALAAQLAEYLAEVGLGTVRTDLSPGAVGQTPTNRPELYVETRVTFNMIRDLAARVELFESDSSGKQVINDHRTLDKDSKILLGILPHAFCAGVQPSCRTLIEQYVGLEIVSKDNAGNEVRKEAAVKNNGGLWEVEASLSDYIGQDIRLEVYYENTGHKFALVNREAKIKNLGLVTTFPVLTEVISLASRATGNKIDPKDDEFKSSIPLSYAFPVRGNGARNLAITAPWMIGWNPREAPDLANIIRVFPHFSVLLPVENATALGDQAKPELAFGAGVALVEAFTIAWGLSTMGNQYLLLGISIPDLARILH